LLVETVLLVMPVDAANVAAVEDPARPDPQDSQADPATPELQETQAVPAGLPLLLASSPSSLRADLAPEASRELLAHQDPQDSQDLPDSPASQEATQPQDHQASQVPLDSQDSPDSPEAQDSQELPLPARLLPHHHQDPQESREHLDSPDTPVAPDSPETPDSLARRDPQDHQDSQAATVSPVLPDSPASLDTPASLVSARSTAPSTVESSSPTALAALKRSRGGSDESYSDFDGTILFLRQTLHFVTATTRILLLLPTKKLPLS